MPGRRRLCFHWVLQSQFTIPVALSSGDIFKENLRPLSSRLASNIDLRYDFSPSIQRHENPCLDILVHVPKVQGVKQAFTTEAERMLVSCAVYYLANTLLRMFNDESHSTLVYVNICRVIC